MSYNAAERKDVRKAEKAAALRTKQDAEVLAQVMGTMNGRGWMYGYLASLSAFHTPFAPDPYLTAFNCGRQNAGLDMLAAVVAVAPDNYILMIREANDRSTATERPSEPLSDGGDTPASDDGDGDEAS